MELSAQYLNKKCSNELLTIMYEALSPMNYVPTVFTECVYARSEVDALRKALDRTTRRLFKLIGNRSYQPENPNDSRAYSALRSSLSETAVVRAIFDGHVVPTTK